MLPLFNVSVYFRQNELEEIKEMFQREIRELNTKYQASQHSLIEMEHRYGGIAMLHSTCYI